MRETAREALLAEALGDLARLLDRIEAVQPSLQATCRDLIRSCDALAGSATAAERRIAAIAESAATKAVHHIAQRTRELARGAADTEIHAFKIAARDALQAEITSALGRLAPVIEAGRQPSRETLFRWCAATGLVAAAVSALIAALVTHCALRI
jgi:hypothetical protein